LSDKETTEVPVTEEPGKEMTEVPATEEPGKETTEVPVTEELAEEKKLTLEDLKELFSKEKQKADDYEKKLKRTLADFQNLEKRTASEIENIVITKIDKLMLDFLQIYDDFIRAKQVFSKSDINTDGLDSILKNMDSLLAKYDVFPIDALGEIFNPKLHEAISITEDPTLEESTITKEIRKGYISHNRAIRPTLALVNLNSKFLAPLEGS